MTGQALMMDIDPDFIAKVILIVTALLLMFFTRVSIPDAILFSLIAWLVVGR